MTCKSSLTTHLATATVGPKVPAFNAQGEIANLHKRISDAEKRVAAEIENIHKVGGAAFGKVGGAIKEIHFKVSCCGATLCDMSW